MIFSLCQFLQHAADVCECPLLYARWRRLLQSLAASTNYSQANTGRHLLTFLSSHQTPQTGWGRFLQIEVVVQIYTKESLRFMLRTPDPAGPPSLSPPHIPREFLAMANTRTGEQASQFLVRRPNSAATVPSDFCRRRLRFYHHQLRVL